MRQLNRLKVEQTGDDAQFTVLIVEAICKYLRRNLVRNRSQINILHIIFGMKFVEFIAEDICHVTNGLVGGLITHAKITVKNTNI